MAYDRPKDFEMAADFKCAFTCKRAQRGDNNGTPYETIIVDTKHPRQIVKVRPTNMPTDIADGDVFQIMPGSKQVLKSANQNYGKTDETGTALPPRCENVLFIYGFVKKLSAAPKPAPAANPFEAPEASASDGNPFRAESNPFDAADDDDGALPF